MVYAMFTSYSRHRCLQARTVKYFNIRKVICTVITIEEVDSCASSNFSEGVPGPVDWMAYRTEGKQGLERIYK